MRLRFPASMDGQVPLLPMPVGAHVGRMAICVDILLSCTNLCSVITPGE